MAVGKFARESGHSIRVAAILPSLLFSAALFGSAAHAGSFRVNPVQIVIPSDRRSTTVTLSNADAAPLSVRARTYIWTQQNGEDVYTPTDSLIASPPIFTVAGGKTQLVRVGFSTKPTAAAYRIIFEEIPPEKPVKGQVQVTLRLNLPVYVPAKDGKPDLSWSAWRDSRGIVTVEGRNSGDLHSQILQLDAESGKGRQVLSNQMGVVLPASSRAWKVGPRPDLVPGKPFTLSVKGSSGETQARIVLEQR